jgi:acetoin utilization deacetylase AcuC-like enzyme
MSDTISYFFTDKQIHDACSFSKSPMKPALVQRTIQNDSAFNHMPQGIIGPIEPSRMKLVHSKRYIDGLMTGTIADGFGNKSRKDLQAIRTTVGNFVVAAEWALTQAHPGVVWSLTSGFHHARHDGGGGFCTINGLMLSAFELQKYHRARTLIVDEDFHFFDGCVDILETIPDMRDYVAMMSSRHTHRAHDLQARRAELEAAIAKHDPTIIAFQAGADMWIGDPLGGSLSMKELYQRDLDTFDVAKRHGIPVVCNLAGGYAENYNNTLRIHRNTGEAMKEVYLGYGKPDFKEEF